jgi:hypothetical protein
MVDDRLHAIPSAQRETARAALIAAFGSAPIGAIAPVRGGASGASAFRVEAGGRRVVSQFEICKTAFL